MTRNSLSTLLLTLICTTLLLCCFVIISSAQETKTRPAHIGFVYPLSTNGTDAANYINNFSLHILAGLANNENSFCLAGISNVVKCNASGVIIAGLSNHIGHNAKGLQLAGLVNTIKNNAEGVQLAGLANVTGNSNGVQIAGLANVAKAAEGVQIAGFVNTAKNANTQVAGFSNLSTNASDVQIAGFINTSQEAKSQVAGFINVAKKVSGVQIAGFINIAEESNYPIGLINISKNGEKQLGITLDETGSTVLALRSGGKVLYGILGVGYNFRNENAKYVVEGGIGAHFPITSAFRANLEITASALSDIQYDVYFKTTTRLLAAYKLANRIEFFAGPTFNHLGFDRYQHDIRKDNYIWSRKNPNYFNGLYIGLMGGIQINL